MNARVTSTSTKNTNDHQLRFERLLYKNGSSRLQLVARSAYSRQLLGRVTQSGEEGEGKEKRGRAGGGEEGGEYNQLTNEGDEHDRTKPDGGQRSS